jgi:soluble lytic murein transglycosylase-like protein
MTGKNRREFLKYGGIFAAGLSGAPRAAEPQTGQPAKLQFLVPSDYRPPAPDNRAYRSSLVRATLEYIEYFADGENIAQWNRPFERIEFEKRLDRMVSVLTQALATVAKHPVDPAWLLAQIFKESRFYEFAISSALAFGPCQFVMSTANHYGLGCAGNRAATMPESGILEQADLVELVDRYEEAGRRLREFRRNGRRFQGIRVADVFKRLLDGDPGVQTLAGEYLEFEKQEESLKLDISEIRTRYVESVLERVRDRDIFNPADLRFLETFDQRFTYRSLTAMVAYMGDELHKFNGNVVAATASYNAGRSAAMDRKHPFLLYGRIPAIEETSLYVSRIMNSYSEISRRMPSP